MIVNKCSLGAGTISNLSLRQEKSQSFQVIILILSGKSVLALEMERLTIDEFWFL